MFFNYENREALAKILAKNISSKSIDTLETLWQIEFNEAKTIGFSERRTVQLLRKGEYQWALSLLFSESDKIPNREESDVWNWFVASTNSVLDF